MVLSVLLCTGMLAILFNCAEPFEQIVNSISIENGVKFGHGCMSNFREDDI